LSEQPFFSYRTVTWIVLVPQGPMTVMLPPLFFTVTTNDVVTDGGPTGNDRELGVTINCPEDV
jgi:hypothetical protein